MHLPVIAIVGRPNVGKSTLLNVLAGRRVSVVDPTEGVTRDRVHVRLERDGRAFELVDTGGIGIVDRQDLSEDVEGQINAALAMADVIVFMVDARTGVTSFDEVIARRLRALERPIVLGANKCESESLHQSLHEFLRLGFGEPLALSAQNRNGTGDLLTAALERLPEDAPAELETPHLKVAIVGRRNAGKSTFVNAIARDDRVIVSEKPGTTRDAVDVWVERGGEKWVLIDTAGITRHAQDGRDPIQWYSEHRAFQAVRRSDVVLLLLDSTRDVGTLEKRIAREIEDSGKPSILVSNKWDLIDDVPTGKFEEYYHDAMPGLRRAPIAFTSGKDRFNIAQTLDLCRDLHAQSLRRLTTGDVNRFVEQCLDERKPRIKHSQMPKIYYATQVAVAPPTIAIFVNEPKLFKPSWRRFLENRFRDSFDFPEVPVRLLFRKRTRKSLNDLKGGL